MIELSKSKYFAFYASTDSFSRWALKIDFGYGLVDLSFCDFMVMKRKLDSIDIASHFETNTSGIEMISTCRNKHVIVLDTLEVIDLKKLFEDTLSAMSVV